MDNNYCVYAHKFPNDKYYIGLTRQKPECRWGCNGNGYKGQLVYDAIIQYGWNNIEHIIVKDNLTLKEAQELEKELIFECDAINNGYNISIGGGSGGNPWCEFEYNGIIYSAEELAEMSKYDITSHDITTRINHHKWSIEKALNTPKRNSNYMIEYNNEKYTIKEIYKIRKNKNLSYETIRDRILHHNWDVERAISQETNIKIQPHGVGTCVFEYNGKHYNSWELCQISNIEGLKPQHITDRVNRRGWSVERAINTPLKKMNQLFNYNGKQYTSKELAELSNINNLTYHDITDRINGLGWSVEKAITTEKQIKVNK